MGWLGRCCDEPINRAGDTDGPAIRFLLPSPKQSILTITISTWVPLMPVQIANPQVVAKIERLSRAIGVGKTAAVEAAIDRMLAQVGASGISGDPWNGIEAIVAQMHLIPTRPDAFDAVQYDEMGLPK